MLEEIFERTKPVDILIIMVAAVAIVSFWRGLWGLMDLYLLPQKPALSFFISIFIGIIILLLLSMHKYRKNKI